MTNGKYPVDTTVSFTCNHGYKRAGSTSSTCQTSGTWNQQTPTCTQSNDKQIPFLYIYFNAHKTKQLRCYLIPMRPKSNFPIDHSSFKRKLLRFDEFNEQNWSSQVKVLLNILSYSVQPVLIILIYVF